MYPGAQGHLTKVGFELRTVRVPITLFPGAGSLQMAGLTPAEPGPPEGRVHVPAPRTPSADALLQPRAEPQPQRREERPRATCQALHV